MMTKKKMVRNGVLILAALAMAAPLAACGKKGSPEHPAGSKYPHLYPTSEEKKEQKAQTQPKQGVVKPGGVEYTYPNRPPSK